MEQIKLEIQKLYKALDKLETRCDKVKNLKVDQKTENNSDLKKEFLNEQIRNSYGKIGVANEDEINSINKNLLTQLQEIHEKKQSHFKLLLNKILKILLIKI